MCRKVVLFRRIMNVRALRVFFSRALLSGYQGTGVLTVDVMSDGEDERASRPSRGGPNSEVRNSNMMSYKNFVGSADRACGRGVQNSRSRLQDPDEQFFYYFVFLGSFY